MTILSLFKEALNINTINIDQCVKNDKFLEYVNIYFDYITENKMRLNISIERDDKFCMEHIVYILLAVDMFVSMLVDDSSDKSDDKYDTIITDEDQRKRRCFIDISCINKDTLLSEKCKNCENSLYGFATALMKNKGKSISCLFFSRDRYYTSDPMSVFFTVDEIKNISKRIKTSRKNERIKIILSKYRKKIKDDSENTRTGSILCARDANILIRYDKEHVLSLDVCITIIDKESYVSIKTIEKQTKQLNKSLLDYLETFINIDGNICPNRLQIIKDINLFKIKLTHITHEHFPTFKFNGSRKHIAISKAIENLMVNENDSSININNNNEDDDAAAAAADADDTGSNNKKNRNSIAPKENSGNHKTFEPFTSIILPLLVNDTITNIWFNRLFLINTHRDKITDNNIKPTGFLVELLKSADCYEDRTKTMEMFRIFSNVCVSLRSNSLPLPFHTYSNKQKKKKKTDFNYCNIQPLTDVQYIQNLPKGTINIKKLLSNYTPSTSGNIIIDKRNDISGSNVQLSSGEVSKFHQYFTSIGKDLLSSI